MNAERMREFLLALPYVLETQQFGGLVYWVTDKAIGGKMFCMLQPESGELLISYPAGAERYNDLLEIDGIRPAPYLARASWVAAERWDVFVSSEWESELRAAQCLTYAKLPARTKAILAMSKANQRRIISERRKLLAAKKIAATK